DTVHVLELRSLLPSLASSAWQLLIAVFTTHWVIWCAYWRLYFDTIPFNPRSLFDRVISLVVRSHLSPSSNLDNLHPYLTLSG
ncbi:hypothetical protein EDC96DRAFT_533525, partial [Choanephora cucurbitarum]